MNIDNIIKKIKTIVVTIAITSSIINTYIIYKTIRIIELSEKIMIIFSKKYEIKNNKEK